MPEYEFRFLKRDGSYAKARDRCWLDSNNAAWSYAVEHYRQKPLEIWCADKLISRRVSPAFEARLKGSYPRSSLFPAISIHELESIEKAGEIIPYREFETLGRISMAVFSDLCLEAQQHRVWVHATHHPQPMPAIPQRLRFSFLIGREPHGWRGLANLSLLSRHCDGPDIVGDLIDCFGSCLGLSLQRMGLAGHRQSTQRPVAPVGADYHSSVSLPWTLKPAAFAGARRVSTQALRAAGIRPTMED